MIDRSTPPPVRSFSPERLPMPEIKELPSGSSLAIYRGGTEPVCCLNILFAGGAQEANPAVASLCAAMLQEGTSGLTSAQIADALDFNGARLSPQCKEHFSGLTVWMLNSRAAEILRIVEDILLHPSFPADKLERCKALAGARLNIQRQRTAAIADEEAQALIKGNKNPQAHKLTADDIMRVTVAQLKDFHSCVFVAGACHCFLSGKVDAAIEGAVLEMLGRLPAGQAMPLNICPYTAEPPGTVNISQKGALQAAVACALPAPLRSSDEYIPLRLAVMALGGYFGSRLMANIREDKGYTYGINAYLAGNLDGSAIYMLMQCAPQYVEPALKEIEYEMRAMASNPPSGDELERLCLYASSAALETLDTPEGILSQYSTALLVGIPDGYFDRQQQIVATLTPDILAEVSRVYLRPELLRTVVVRG